MVLVETLKGTLIFAHFGLAAATKAPEFALTEQQAAAMAAATADVLSYYDTTLPAKTMAWVNLAMCAGGIYAQKLGDLSMRVRAERAKRVVQGPVLGGAA